MSDRKYEMKTSDKKNYKQYLEIAALVYNNRGLVYISLKNYDSAMADIDFVKAKQLGFQPLQ